ncbi:MAG: PQQ-binding-like beta-propeller repeat protein [Planctomycetaceae bacterium]
MSFRLTTCLLALTLLSAATQADDWPQFRGVRGDGVAHAAGTPVRVSESNTVWKTAIPGSGWSSPVYSGDNIWITAADVQPASAEFLAKKKQGVEFADMKTGAGSVKLRAVCVHLKTGKILHNVLLKNVSEPELIHPLNSYASPTPVISGDRVVCHFGSYGTWCVNAESGEKIWEQNTLIVDHSVGPGSSPVIVDDIVILAFDGIDRQFVTGLSLKDGTPSWKTPRPKMRATNGEYQKAYSTPLIIEIDGQLQAVLPGAQWMCAYEPATGREIWRADCGNGFSTTPMAIYDAGLVICSTGFMRPALVAVNPSGTGDVTKTHIVWTARQGGSTMPTAVAHNGLIYSLGDRGIMTVLESKTGKKRSRFRVNGNYSASPLLVDEKLYIGSKEGLLTVYSLNDINGNGGDVKPLAKNKLDGDIMASPATIGSDMLIRTSKSLMRVKPE